MAQYNETYEDVFVFGLAKHRVRLYSQTCTHAHTHTARTARRE